MDLTTGDRRTPSEEVKVQQRYDNEEGLCRYGMVETSFLNWFKFGLFLFS
ncbi:MULTISPECIES: hypothetical protein [unclassified Sphingobacterium]|nr:MULTISPECIES: hypothetical protein [unclassified Sphingobacterium]WET70093.1 MAG: hypothetical protein P0Y57_03145 [Sphingobacterium sp.]